MRRLLTVAAVGCVLTGCASAVSAPAATAPATSAPAPSCAAATTFDSAGRFAWSGTTYSPLGQATVTDKDTAGLLFAVGCDGAKAYGLRGMRSTCEVVVLNTDAFDAYAPSPLPSGCPAPVTSSGGHIAALPTSLADCPVLPSQPVGQGTQEDFGDSLVNGGTTFAALGKPTTAKPDGLAAVQFSVRCSYNELNTVTHQATPELRSHDATFVPAGSPVYALTGWPPSCRLAAQHDGEWHVYLALDPQAGPGTFKACASGDSPPSQEPSPTRTNPATVTGSFGSCPSPSPTQSGAATIVDYADALRANGRSYTGDLGQELTQSPVKDSDRGARQLTVACTESTWSQRYGQGVAAEEDGYATFLPAGTIVYAVKGHSPLCQLMAMTNGQWDLFTSTAAGCPSPPPPATALPSAH